MPVPHAQRGMVTVSRNPHWLLWVAAADLRLPAEVSSLPVFPRGLRGGRYQPEIRQAGETTKLEWVGSKKSEGGYEVITWCMQQPSLRRAIIVC